MVGFAVKVRCSRCVDHCWLTDVAAPPDTTVMLTLRCRCRKCKGLGNAVYVVRDGRARLLLDKERAAMIRAASKTPAERAAMRRLPAATAGPAQPTSS